MRPCRQAGFTYIELLVTVALIGLLATMALPLLAADAKRSREFQLAEDLRMIRTAIDAYKQKTVTGEIEKSAMGSGYPPTLAVLASGVSNRQDPTGQKKFYFLRQVPRDPMCDCPDQSATETWQLRSYNSPPDDPQYNDDVYDVHSRSTEKGLNGIPYKDW